MKKTMYYMAVFLVISLVGNPAVSEAAMEIFLFIPQIPGGSTESAHQDWIDVESINHQLSRQVDTSTDYTRSRTSVNIGDIDIVKKMDKASPKLAIYALTGQIVPEVLIDIVTAGGKGKIIVMNYKLTNVLITGVQTYMASPGDVPSETVSLNFSKIEWNYTPIKPDGSPEAKIKSFWDVKANTGN